MFGDKHFPMYGNGNFGYNRASFVKKGVEYFIEDSKEEISKISQYKITKYHVKKSTGLKLIIRKPYNYDL